MLFVLEVLHGGMGGGGGGMLFVAVVELLHSRITEVARGIGGYMYLWGLVQKPQQLLSLIMLLLHQLANLFILLAQVIGHHTILCQLSFIQCFL